MLCSEYELPRRPLHSKGSVNHTSDGFRKEMPSLQVIYFWVGSIKIQLDLLAFPWWLCIQFSVSIMQIAKDYLFLALVDSSES